MAGYWIVHGSAVKDQGALTEYGKLWGPIAESYHAELVACGKRHQARERDDWARAVVVKFPTYEKAIACYDDSLLSYHFIAGHLAEMIGAKLVQLQLNGNQPSEITVKEQQVHVKIVAVHRHPLLPGDERETSQSGGQGYRPRSTSGSG